MKILIVRHGDPDYSVDSLTEKGWREAEYLSERLKQIDVKAFYVSPLGRAKDTASCTLKKVGATATECSWLREFRPQNTAPFSASNGVIWDQLPQTWMTEERFFSADQWFEPQSMRDGGVKQEYDWVTGCFDALLEQHGYRRKENWYEAIRPNNDTLVFFCHFGVGCVLLSHLLHVSPMILWHGLCAAPSSVTTVVTEERREGIAAFRMSSYGDTSHLYVHGEEPAFAGRFCECYSN
ncbi:MAG: histidine phosphatase family protein [Eubacteriales bacterium]|nr:histidine phosphatase family protein [Eubacteriales bacterium]